MSGKKIISLTFVGSGVESGTENKVFSIFEGKKHLSDKRKHTDVLVRISVFLTKFLPCIFYNFFNIARCNYKCICLNKQLTI